MPEAVQNCYRTLLMRRSGQATDSVMGEDGHVYHYHHERLVGVTILHASQCAQVTGE